MTTSKPPAEQTVMSVLASHSGATAAEIATAGKLGRSTVSKTLAKLKRAGKVKRKEGGHDGARRLPDRWSLARTRTSKPHTSNGRLRPGELDGLVLDYMNTHKADGPLGPAAIAHGLERSSGAVANCLKRLATTRQVRQISKQPLRYRVKKG